MYQEKFEVLRKIKKKEPIENKSIVNELLAENFIDEKNQLTQIGEDFLAKHQVDNAIIVAAGLGTRFVPHTMLQPKGLISVKGEPLVERLIKQLQEAGIDEIILVVGYLKEQFDYLVDKYGVTIVENNDYNRMNNISSVFAAKDYLKNSYLLPSDIRVESNPFNKYEYQSWYAARYFEEDSGEWTLHYDDNGLITNVTESEADSWAMYGPAYLSASFSKVLKEKIIVDYYDVDKRGYFWENTYLDHIEELPMYIKKYPSDEVIEFESFADLRAYDDHYWEDSESPIIKKIARIFDVRESEITDIELLEKGMTNKSFIFKVKDKKYVFRQPGVGSERLINRYQEAEVYEAVNSLGITDEIVYLNAEKGVKITVYYENSQQSSSMNREDVKKTLDLYKILHGADLKVSHRFDLRERLGHYQMLVDEVDGYYPDDFQTVLLRNKKLLDYLDDLDRDETLCHIDSIENNVLKLEDGTYKLIDWEYAGMCDPLIDIAAYVVYAGYEEREIDEMLEYYLERRPNDEEITVVYSYVSLISFLWALWSWYKEEFGNDFMDYADSQYYYAKKYSSLVLERISNE